MSKWNRSQLPATAHLSNREPLQAWELIHGVAFPGSNRRVVCRDFQGPAGRAGPVAACLDRRDLYGDAVRGGQIGDRLDLGREATASTHGTAGALALVLLWVSCSSIILPFGAEIEPDDDDVRVTASQ